MDIVSDSEQNCQTFDTEMSHPPVKTLFYVTSETRQQSFTCLNDFKTMEIQSNAKKLQWREQPEWKEIFKHCEALTPDNLEIVLNHLKSFWNSQDPDPLIHAVKNNTFRFLRILWACKFPFDVVNAETGEIPFFRICQQIGHFDVAKYLIGKQCGYVIQLNGTPIAFQDGNELVSFYLANPKILDRSGFLHGLVRDDQSTLPLRPGLDPCCCKEDPKTSRMFTIFAPYFRHNEDNGPSNPGLTPLHAACAEGHLEMVKLVLEHSTLRKIDVNPKDRFGNTPLHYACFFGHKKIVELMTRSGLDLGLKNKQNMTPQEFGDMKSCDEFFGK